MRNQLGKRAATDMLQQKPGIQPVDALAGQAPDMANSSTQLSTDVYKRQDQAFRSSEKNSGGTRRHRYTSHVQRHPEAPVSYTHLDVYKRQLHKRSGVESSSNGWPVRFRKLSQMSSSPVSYTHLDVYKRQASRSAPPRPVPNRRGFSPLPDKALPVPPAGFASRRACLQARQVFPAKADPYTHLSPHAVRVSDGAWLQT